MNNVYKECLNFKEASSFLEANASVARVHF